MLLAELKGVWQIDGMQMPQSQVQATEESNVPDCANDRTLFNYVGLDFDAPRVSLALKPSAQCDSTDKF